MLTYDNNTAVISMLREEWDSIAPTVIEDLAVASELLIANDMGYRSRTLLELIKHLGYQVYDPNFTMSISECLVEIADEEEDNNNNN